MKEWSVEIIRYPTEKDWKRCLYLARATQGKYDDVKEPSTEWKQKILKAEHSPIRTLMFTIVMKDIPYYSSVHFARHKYGVEHYVQSQRINPDRGAERQDAPVTHIMDINAQALIAMMRKRLCYKADETTRMIARVINTEVINATPEFVNILYPECMYRNGYCPEMKSCGKMLLYADYDTAKSAGAYASQPLMQPGA